MPKKQKLNLQMMFDLSFAKNNGNSPATNASSYPVKNKSGDKSNRRCLRFANCFHSFRSDFKGAKCLVASSVSTTNGVLTSGCTSRIDGWDSSSFSIILLKISLLFLNVSAGLKQANTNAETKT